MKKEITAYDVALEELGHVAKIMNLTDEQVAILSTPRRILTVNVPLRMDDGSTRFYTGYRAQHNGALGPVKGGTRLHPDETLDDVKALSFWMTIKNALAGLPAGGAKGGIAVDPASLSKAELERLCRSYIREVFPILDPKIDIPGPDVGTPQQVMAWFLDEYEILAQGHNPAAFAGKPPLIGGSLGRDRATGRGLVYSAGELMRQLGGGLEGKRIVLQGFGNLGSHAATFFAEHGAVIIAVSDVNGGIVNKNGLDVAALHGEMREHGTIVNFAGADAISNSDLLELECDLLVPCALQNQITEANADKLRAKYVVEGANGPTTPAAERILAEKGIVVLPDIVANVGGAVVAYFEWVQDSYHYFWSEEEVFSRLETIMTKTCRDVYAMSREKKLTMRHAAWVTALTKVIDAMKLRGWV